MKLENCDLKSDQYYIERFISGDKSGIDMLITRHKDRVYTYIYLIVKNKDLTEDIFQDVFIKVIQSLRAGKYKDNGKFLAWVFRIAHNLIIDHFRQEKMNRVYSNDDYELDLFNSEKFSDENCEDVMIQSQIHSEVRNLVDCLPDDQKEVIVLRHYKGLSFKEIADDTDVSINTALGRMRYALINLRKMIEENQLNLQLS
ncbi:sigma-70 family RNA polymerase sigma factor [Ancylomarina sp. DW003]|nr:sigma-70 family RNA polymerase sigma factor [Ancylomarina sp. DW003]MDE5422183.1 sigma-70 family RNA polymerase sigma factor [Ancylomarina sp. DW003]